MLRELDLSTEELLLARVVRAAALVETCFAEGKEMTLAEGLLELGQGLFAERINLPRVYP